ncbi:hypothetical protein FJT64_019038 [Amphibalanus amphitrite]|uniref:VCBS repeat-containing protein n=1 Tax=Amphibalanus amphitrite TaxID=1232801 RepID=A0A6A4X6F0_AMPAM|nr:hypothetical protein FJT64_019038 [Amphibalanus amphitrite]
MPGKVAVANASFVEVFTAAVGAGDAVERTTLYVSSFNPENILGTDKVYRVPAPGRQLDAVSDWQLQLLDHNAYWTNDIDYMAPQAVGFEGVIVTSGYLGTFHTHGKLQVFNTETFNKKELAHTPLKSLAFMINEGTPVDGIWRQKDVVEGGPDAGFRMWNERLALYWSETGHWTDPASVRSRVVDNTTGSIFDVFYSDLNGDGAPEVWATAYDHAADSGAVYAWTVPEDFAAGDWRRVTTADGFRAAEVAVGERVSPGEAVAFHPSRAARTAGEKPLILLSGNGDGSHYVLQPASAEAADWRYERLPLVSPGGTAGQVAVADLDGDGFTELLAAGHTAGSLAVFSYGPQ